jgi:hypothetical protein
VDQASCKPLFVFVGRPGSLKHQHAIDVASGIHPHDIAHFGEAEVARVALETHVIDATTKIGYPLAAIRPIGLIALLCTILYALPRTAVLGAILLTGFYGGAVASKIRIEDPLFSSILFAVYMGLIAWGGLYLRDDRLRALFPFHR